MDSSHVFDAPVRDPVILKRSSLLRKELFDPEVDWDSYQMTLRALGAKQCFLLYELQRNSSLSWKDIASAKL